MVLGVAHYASMYSYSVLTRSSSNTFSHSNSLILLLTTVLSLTLA